jgi:DNA invertase Pin-like site-specific DNA recombinase
MPRPLKRPEAPVDPYKLEPLPVGRPAAVYYRQSSEGQIGNISTTLQTVDMIEHLLRQGWVRESVHMIDMDAGVSGQKKIQERKGMSMLYDLIERGQIGLVAAQDVDRFFRDVTMIETNMFIDACKRNNVKVMTPMMIYDFAHPIMGPSHIKMFREESQRAADYLEYQIRGRLVKARQRRDASGLWTGRKVLPGFMVDTRSHLPNDALNPDFRKYKRFDLYADVLLAYYERFRANDGNFKKTWQQIDQHGPAFPDIPADTVPKGFKATEHLKRRSPFTGGLTPSETGLMYMLTNVAYIGHWIHKGAIVQFNNHEAIVPLDLFMYAYNRLSPTDFYGQPNPDYIPYRPWIRHPKEERNQPPPTYAYLAYSDDLPEQPHKRLACIWNTGAKKYQYQLANPPYHSNVWNIRAEIVDSLVDAMLLERLEATTIDEALWQAALASHEHLDQGDIRRVQAAIRQAEQTKDNLIASLGLLSNGEMVARAQARYEATEGELVSLHEELARLQSAEQGSRSLVDARPVLETIIRRWAEVPREEKRSLFEQFATHLTITKHARHHKRLVIHWRDGSTSERVSGHKSRGYFWDEADLEKLRQMIDQHVDQVEILKAFPSMTWRSLLERYAYRWGDHHYPTHYQGKRPYPRSVSWTQTAEYKAEAAFLGKPLPQLAASYASIDPLRPIFCGEYGRSSLLQSENPAAMDGASGGRPHPPQ